MNVNKLIEKKRNCFNHIFSIKHALVLVETRAFRITSPGGLAHDLTVEKAISGCSQIRRKAIAEVLSYMRDVKGWDSGFLRRGAEKLYDYDASPVEIEDIGIATRLNAYYGGTRGIWEIL